MRLLHELVDGVRDAGARIEKSTEWCLPSVSRRAFRTEATDRSGDTRCGSLRARPTVLLRACLRTFGNSKAIEPRNLQKSTGNTIFSYKNILSKNCRDNRVCPISNVLNRLVAIRRACAVDLVEISREDEPTRTCERFLWGAGHKKFKGILRITLILSLRCPFYMS